MRLYFYGTLVAIFFVLAIFVKNPVFINADAPAGISKANPARLKSTVETLVASQPPRNYEHPEALDKISDYISAEFAKAGLLELARILAPLKDKLKRPIELVAYTLEEPPNFRGVFMGSYVHAESLHKAGTKIKLMISLEMIGYFNDEAWSQKYPMPLFYLLFPTTGDYVALLARPSEWGIMREVKTLFEGATALPTQTANVSEVVPGLGLSDHFNYWDLDFPALMITDTAFMRNHAYHQKNDTPDRLNYEKMADVVNGVAAVGLGL